MQILGVRFGTVPAEIDIAVVVNDRYVAARVSKRFVEISAASTPQRIVCGTQTGVCDRRKIDLSGKVIKIVINQRQAFDWLVLRLDRDLLASDSSDVPINLLGDFGQSGRTIRG